MKKLIALLLAVLSLTLVGCSKNSTGAKETTTIIPTTTTVATTTTEKPYVNVSSEELSIESLRSKSFTYELLTDEPITLSIDDESIATFTDVDGVVTVTTYKEGETYLRFKTVGKTVKAVKITVEKQFITFALAYNEVVLKGKNVTCNVKAVLTDTIEGVEPVWTVENEGICTIETQGLICRITSVYKGITTVTLTYGEYQESFTVKVTNVRGEIE